MEDDGSNEKIFGESKMQGQGRDGLSHGQRRQEL